MLSQHDEELSFKDALEHLKIGFNDYIGNQVLSKVDLGDMEIFYIGLPTKKFPDFEKLCEYILSGELVTNIEATEANENMLSSTK